MFTDAPKSMKSFKECRHTQRAGGTWSSLLFNVRSKRQVFCEMQREPGPMSVVLLRDIWKICRWRCCDDCRVLNCKHSPPRMYWHGSTAEYG